MPHLLAIADGCGVLYKGFLIVHDREFRLEIKTNDDFDLASIDIFCDCKLKDLLKDHLSNLKDKFKECKNLEDLLQHLEKAVVFELGKKSEIETTTFSCGLIIEELETIGWNRLVKVSSSFDEIHLSCDDVTKRKHVLKIKLDKQHPQVVPIVTHLLPVQLDTRWNEQPSLKSLFSIFEKLVQDLQRFWEIMDDIDTNCKVIEPIQPTSTDTHRRIAIETLVSIQVTFEPLKPQILPDIKFFGSDEATRKLKDTFYECFSLWDPDERPTVNLRNILGVELMKTNKDSSKSKEVNCSICLTFLMEEETPDVRCSSKCSQRFHASCIVEWLKIQPGTRKSFNILFGKCPNCKQMLSVSL